MEWLNHPMISLSCLCFAVIVFGLYLSVWLKLKVQQQQLATLDRFVRKELSVMSQSHVIMGKRLIYVESNKPESNKSESDGGSKKNNVQEPVEESFDFQEKLHSGSYNSALNLLKQGMSSDDVAKRCGLSKAETSLMQLVNRESPVGH